jgi:stress response protein SCP2
MGIVAWVCVCVYVFACVCVCACVCVLSGALLTASLLISRPATDLDCAVLLFDSNTALVDACYYNQREIFGGAVKHSGDVRDGAKRGFDEVITMDLKRLPQAVQIVVIIVNAYRGGTLADVQTAHVTIQQVGIVKASLGVSYGYGCGSIVALLKRHDDVRWNLRPIGEPVPGRTFEESYGGVLSSLAAVVDPAIIAERRASMRKTFHMLKDDIVELSDDLFISGEDLFVGLGWDTHCDLDASILVTASDADGARAVDVVNFENKTFGKAIMHHGEMCTRFDGPL